MDGKFTVLKNECGGIMLKPKLAWPITKMLKGKKKLWEYDP